MAKKWWEYLTGGSDEGDANFSMGDLFSSDTSSEPAYNIYDFGNLEQALSDAQARDFLSGMEAVSATEGTGVAGTGILTQGTNIPSGKGVNFADLLKQGGGALLDYVKANPGKVGLMGVLAALGALAKASPSGGGTTKAYQGPSAPLTRTVTQGRYGPIAQYAAQGGIMHAYAHGGQVKPFPMQDGGFVMTEDAMKGAEKTVPGGIYALLPETEPIIGPGTGKSDSIPAYIRGRNNVTPARVSNGEGYVPPGRNTKQLYALMKSLERRA